jgi:hypothetical protein
MSEIMVMIEVTEKRMVSDSTSYLLNRSTVNWSARVTRAEMKMDMEERAPIA